MKLSIQELLSQSPGTQLPNHCKFQKILQLIAFTIQHIIEGLELFYIKQDLGCFDPHVGETACQIRAYKNLLLANQIKSKTPFVIANINELTHLYEKISHSISFYTKIENTPAARNLPETTLDKFMQNLNCNVLLDEDVIYLTLSRILTKYKYLDEKGNSYIDTNALQNALSLSREGAKQLSIFYQRKLAKLSCDFITAISQQLPSPLSISMIHTLTLDDDNMRKTLPCYLTTKIILAHMQSIGLGFTLAIQYKREDNTIDIFYLNFCVNHNNIFKYSETCEKPFHLILHIITNGDVLQPQNKKTLAQQFSKFNTAEMILLNQAIHPQYTGTKLSPYKNNPFIKLHSHLPPSLYCDLENELAALRQKALSQGYGDRTLSFFYIEHIFCARIPNTSDATFEKHLSAEKKEHLSLMD